MARREPSFLKDLPDPKKPLTEASLKAFGQTPLPNFDTSRFPTRSNVLGRFIFERDLSKQRPKRDIAKQIYAELVPIYDKGLDIPNPTKKNDRCENEIIKNYDDWNVAAMHQNQNKMTSKEKSFVNDLPKLFDIIAPDAEEQIKKDRNRSTAAKKEDIDFIRDQRNERRQIMTKLDTRYAKKIDAKIARNKSFVCHQLDQSLHISSPNRPTQQTISLMPTKLRPKVQGLEQKYVGCESDEDVESSIGQFNYGQRTIELDQDYQQTPFLRENRKSDQRKVVSVAKDPATLQALDATNTSSRNAFKILAPATAAMGGAIQKTTLSHRTLERQRKKVRANVADEVKASFQPPKHAVVHFDAKILTDMSGEFGDRLAVVLSGDAPDCKQGKLLSAKNIRDGTGKNQAEEVISSLKNWDVQDNVCGMCFDTTSSNTGWIKGACVLIEKNLGRPLLWLACRHHIPELLLKAAWQTLFGIDMEPCFTEFGKFQKVWENLDKNDFDFLNPESKSWMKKHRNKVVPFLTSLLESEKQPRDDYRECLELVLMVLGSPPKKFSFKKPGPYHKARWMAPMIYGLKMFLFRSQLKKSKKDLEKLERFAIFVSLFYAEHWFTAPLAAEAPFMDLQLYKNMLQYKKFDPEIATAVLNKFMGHTWYLNQEYVPLSLFSKNVSDKDKEDIAKKLTKVTPPKKYDCGYPNPVPLPQNAKGLGRKLSDSIMSGSLFLFDALDFGKDWLYKPITDWESNKSFCEMKSWVQNLKVTNDCAERGVKLISDYANSLTKNSNDRENLLQVVEKHRKQYPNVTKATFLKNYSASEN